MEFLLFALIIVMLMVFGYMQLQKDVIRMPGKLTPSDEEAEEVS
jgi:hypothetical protein